MFNIIDKNHNLIGNCDIRKEKGNRNYSLGICIGEQDSRNKGIGTEVIHLLIKFCFEELGAHRVCLTLNGDNLRAKRCYEKAGMKECGREHETSWYKVDMVLCYLCITLINSRVLPRLVKISPKD